MTKVKVIPTNEFKEEFESYKKDVLKCTLRVFKCDPNWNTLNFLGVIGEKEYKSIRKSVRMKLNKDCNYTITDEQLKSILVSLDADFGKAKLPKYKIEKLTEGNHTQVFIDELREDHEKQAEHNKYDTLMEMCDGNAKDKMNNAKRIVATLNKNS
jgi:hypothetical protein